MSKNVHLKPGSVVIYTDHVRVDHHALVTAVWGDGHMCDGTDARGHAISPPALNLVFVEDDEAKHDDWGNQIGRDSSVVHSSSQPAGANCWRLPE